MLLSLQQIQQLKVMFSTTVEEIALQCSEYEIPALMEFIASNTTDISELLQNKSNPELLKKHFEFLKTYYSLTDNIKKELNQFIKNEIIQQEWQKTFILLLNSWLGDCYTEGYELSISKREKPESLPHDNVDGISSSSHPAALSQAEFQFFMSAQAVFPWNEYKHRLSSQQLLQLANVKKEMIPLIMTDPIFAMLSPKEIIQLVKENSIHAEYILDQLLQNNPNFYQQCGLKIIDFIFMLFDETYFKHNPNLKLHYVIQLMQTHTSLSEIGWLSIFNDNELLKQVFLKTTHKDWQDWSVQLQLKLLFKLPKIHKNAALPRIYKLLESFSNSDKASQLSQLNIKIHYFPALFVNLKELPPESLNHYLLAFPIEVTLDTLDDDPSLKDEVIKQPLLLSLLVNSLNVPENIINRVLGYLTDFESLEATDLSKLINCIAISNINNEKTKPLIKFTLINRYNSNYSLDIPLLLEHFSFQEKLEILQKNISLLVGLRPSPEEYLAEKGLSAYFLGASPTDSAKTNISKTPSSPAMPRKPAIIKTNTFYHIYMRFVDYKIGEGNRDLQLQDFKVLLDTIKNACQNKIQVDQLNSLLSRHIKDSTFGKKLYYTQLVKTLSEQEGKFINSQYREFTQWLKSTKKRLDHNKIKPARFGEKQRHQAVASLLLNDSIKKVSKEVIPSP